MSLSAELIGVWIAAFLTLAIFSFLFDDNPLYKAAEHLFAGVSAGYGVVLAYWEFIRPTLFSKLWPQRIDHSDNSILESIWYGIYNLFYEITTLFGLIEPTLLTKNGIKGASSDISFSYIIPLILGLLMLTRLIPKLSWLARYSIAYVVGVFAGLRAFNIVQTNILNQVKGFSQLVLSDVFSIISNLILVVGTICAIVYFFFSKRHEGFIGKISKTGIWVLMISFGAAFGYTVMARISLLIGRFDDLINFNAAKYYYSTLWCSAIVIITLAIYFYMRNKNNKKEIDKSTN